VDSSAYLNKIGVQHRGGKLHGGNISLQSAWMQKHLERL